MCRQTCVADAVRTTSYSTLTVTWYHSECCVLSGVALKTAGDSVVHYYLPCSLLRGHRVAVNTTWALFRS